MGTRGTMKEGFICFFVPVGVRGRGVHFEGPISAYISRGLFYNYQRPGW